MGKMRWNTWGRELASIVWPRGCAGCNGPDVRLCRYCHDELAGQIRRCEALFPALSGVEVPVWALGRYAGARRAMLLAWKHGKRPDICADFVAELKLAGAGVGAELVGGFAAERGRGRTPVYPVIVVPAPSGFKRRWRRRLVTPALARATAEGIAGSMPTAVADILHLKACRTQAGADQASRWAQRRSAITCRASFGDGEPKNVILVDDVITTGATARACVQALQQAGATVLGVVSVAAVRLEQKHAGAGALTEMG